MKAKMAIQAFDSGVRREKCSTAAQHSVHPIPGSVRRGWRRGSLRVFKQFAWLVVGSVKVASSRPAYQPILGY